MGAAPPQGKKLSFKQGPMGWQDLSLVTGTAFSVGGGIDTPLWIADTVAGCRSPSSNKPMQDLPGDNRAADHRGHDAQRTDDLRVFVELAADRTDASSANDFSCEPSGSEASSNCNEIESGYQKLEPFSCARLVRITSLATRPLAAARRPGLTDDGHALSGGRKVGTGATPPEHSIQTRDCCSKPSRPYCVLKRPSERS
jgi:hypothetical protein